MGILFRIKEVRIGKSSESYYTLTNVKQVEWKDREPWVILEIPKGEAIYQHLRPHIVEGQFTCLDIDSLNVALFETDISVDEGNQYAINSTNGKKTKIEYFVAIAYDHKGVEHTYTFTNVRIRTVDNESITEESKEAGILVTFYSELVVES